MSRICFDDTCIIVLYNNLYLYTVSHKKHATLLWIITSTFLDGFQHFVHQCKKK